MKKVTVFTVLGLLIASSVFADGNLGPTKDNSVDCSKIQAAMDAKKAQQAAAPTDPAAPADGAASGK